MRPVLCKVPPIRPAGPVKSLCLCLRARAIRFMQCHRYMLYALHISVRDATFRPPLAPDGTTEVQRDWMVTDDDLALRKTNLSQYSGNILNSKVSSSRVAQTILLYARTSFDHIIWAAQKWCM